MVPPWCHYDNAIMEPYYYPDETIMIPCLNGDDVLVESS